MPLRLAGPFLNLLKGLGRNEYCDGRPRKGNKGEDCQTLSVAIQSTIQGDHVGLNAGNGEKLRYSQAARLAWLFLAAA